MTEPTLADDRVRPTDWGAYVGQEQLKNRLEIAVKAAISQGRRLDDILMVAPPGTGKTTLAALIADRFHSDFLAFTCPVKMDRFCWQVEELESGVVLLDEIHSAPARFQEMLQPALEDDRVLRTPDGFEIDVSDITFIAATVPEFSTKVLQPLKDRFEIKPHWVDYSDEDLAAILGGMARRLGFELDADVASGLAGACHGTPRLAKRFVKAARDLGAVDEKVTVESVLDYVGVDAEGLGADHLDYLRILRTQPLGRASLRAMATLMMMSPSAVEDLERALRLKGLIQIGSSGRKLSDAGRSKVGARKERRSA